MYDKVESKQKLNLWDWSTCVVPFPVGDGCQSLRWLGFAACSRMAFEAGEVSTKFVPQGVKLKDKLVDIDMILKDVCQHGDHLVVEYSGGPKAYTLLWEGRSPSPSPQDLLRESHRGENDDLYDLISEVDVLITRVVSLISDVVEEVDAVLHGKLVNDFPSIMEQTQEDMAPKVQLDEDGNPILPPPPEPDPPKDEETFIDNPLSYIDWKSYGVVELIQKCLSERDEQELYDEFLTCRDILKGYDGQLQAMILWYGSKGKELEDKDFAVLDFEQWQELWIDANISSTILDPLYGGCGTSTELASLAEMVAHFVVDLLVPNFGKILEPTLEELQSAEIPSSIAIFIDVTPTVQTAINIFKPVEDISEPKYNKTKEHEGVEGMEIDVIDGKTPQAARLENDAKGKVEVKETKKKEGKKGGKGEVEPVEVVHREVQADVPEEIKNLLPYFKKWKILGPHWDALTGATCMIYALQTMKTINDFQNLPTDKLSFGLIELKRMLLAASHSSYLRSVVKRVSEPSYVQTHLQSCFQRAGIARPLYSNYEEKKAYLRKICLRYGGDPPPQPPVFEKK